MNRSLPLLLFVALQLRADIPGYILKTPVLDAEIHPRLVSAAPNGNVWFAQQTTIGFFTPSGHVTNFPIPCTKCGTGEEVVYVWDLATAPDSSVWFIDNHARADGTSIDSAIVHLTTSGEFTFYPIPTTHGTAVVPGGFGQSSITLAPDGTVWFTENAGFRAGSLVPATRALKEYPLEMPEQPAGITVGTDGKVWYTVADHEIAQITPPSNGEFVEFSLASGSFPFGITTGSDANIWVTEAGRHRIARIRPSGTISEFALPTTNGTPQQIAPAPDGTLWYTESTGRDVGRITLNGTSAPTFQMIETPGQENSDITVTPGALVYFTGRDVASGRDKLSLIAPAGCSNGPSIAGPYDRSGTRTFRGTFAIAGKAPLTIAIQGLPASWTAQLGAVTLIDSGPTPPLGTYTFTISVTDAEGCSISQQVTVRIVDFRQRTVKH
jgi:virginiamycin B lyase